MNIRRGLWAPPLIFLLLYSCGKAPAPGPARQVPEAGDAPAPEAGGAEGPPVFPQEALAALLRPTENPLWFEVSSAAGEAGKGPRHIPSPAEAELVPFTPWPLAPHVAATLIGGEALYLAVNRDSLLAILPLGGGDWGLYRFAGGDYWESYTIGNLFLYDDKPALFFYRDDTFAEPAAPPPSPPALALRSGAPSFNGETGAAAIPGGALFTRLAPLDIPVLAELPPGGWEADILRRGADGWWYYRGARRKNGGREARYFRAAALSGPGEEIGVGAYRSAQVPGAEAPGDSPLPPLPENFVYTQVNRLGDLTIAAWEEQEDYSIGAAGFMVIRLP
jgi:hypothetical protein